MSFSPHRIALESLVTARNPTYRETQEVWFYATTRAP